MVSSVTATPNHYEVLGLASTASADEIAKAYAAQMTTFRLRPENALKRLASLSTAYETLRDPAKRRAYDQSLGARTEPALRQERPPFIAAVAARPEPLPDPVPEPRPNPRPDPRPDVGSFIAASLRPPLQNPGREAVAAAPTEPVSFAVDEEPARRPIDRNQATIAAGLVGLAVLALAISVVGRTPERLPVPAAAAPQAVTVGLPPATPAPAGAAAQPPAPTIEAAVPPEQAPVEAAAQPAAVPPATVAAPEQQPATETASTEAPATPTAQTPAASADQTPAAPADANAAPAAAADSKQAPATDTAKLPLANATIARTIERIGYACGSVASTGAMDSSGVFKVTCSSGDTYQATPVHGRYHFRKLGGQ